MIDVEQLCLPVEQEQPAGIDLEYDQDFLALELALCGKPERQVGDSIIASEPPNWKDVLERALSLAARTRDLRIACSITRALTHLEGLDGLVQGLTLTHRWCLDFWESVYPRLDSEDDNDPTVRMNALAPFTDAKALMADIRDCCIVSVRGMGGCTVRELEVALGILTPPVQDARTWRSLNDIDALFAMAHQQQAWRHNLALEAIDLCHSLSGALNDRVGSDRAISFQPLVTRLKPIAEFAKKFTSQEDPAAVLSHEAPDPPVLANVMARAPGVQLASTEIKSSQDACRMLDLVCTYFEKHEPTNPAPLLLRRAQRLSTMTFFDIVRDIAPDALTAVETVTGSQASSTSHNDY